MMRENILLILLLSCTFLTVWGQKTFPENGVFDHREGLYAFVNATIHTTPIIVLKDATLVVKDGKIIAVGAGISIPKDAVVYDMLDKHIYPSFIDIYSNYGMPAPSAVGEELGRQPQMLSNKDGAYMWNEALKPEFRAGEAFKASSKSAEELRGLGFGAVLTHMQDGISRGTSCLTTLGTGKEHELIIKEKVAHHLSFSKGRSTQSYPSSLMGGIALIRQTYYDAKWYTSQDNDKEYNVSLEAWNDMNGLPQIFEVRDRLDIFRANKIAKEFNTKYIIKGSGDEYMRLDAIKATGSSLIIPVTFPEAYDVSDAFDAMQVSLSDMKHWELAPTNPGKLAAANIPFAFTMKGLKDKGNFLANIKKAIKNGLSESDALAALTMTPAKLMKAESLVGSLENGKIANFIVTNKSIFEDGATIHQNWVAGQGFILKQFPDEASIGEGMYNFNIGKKKYSLEITWKEDKPKYQIIENDSTNIAVNYDYANKIISLSFMEDEKKVRLSGTVKNSTAAKGKGYDANGNWISWSISPTRELVDKKDEEEKDDEKEDEKVELGKITYPFLPYGWAEKPRAKSTLIKNATLWTNEKEGIIQADILLINGKISQIGESLNATADIVIDAKGKHVTSGIIDEHSHIAISRGVNEGTQYSSAEVSIADVVNSEDVNIYRNLAGGVVAAQLLHGSANPIGGQSGMVKFKWGFTPEEMKIKNAAPFIKFALGENVKQSNWGDEYTIRFPQSRMGVEQVYDDHFTRAKEYGKLKRSGKAYRKDLEMETLLEIIESKRFVTCHSYVQSEINMLMKVAERHGFTLNTFTHILEGYKIADKMKAHGAGGSTFSDWWAYKYEVIDAIPYNAAILSKMGVVTALNSDDAEMSRRLNQEAAKTIMYGGMSEEEAWKLVTLNPAILLHLDKEMGSLKIGKSADVVIWSDNPLSIYAKAEQTYIDGILFYDSKRDLQLRKEISEERNRLIQKMIGVKEGGGKTQAPSMKFQQHYHCDHVDDEMGEQQQNHDH
ncbi:MAG: imidazolonepropionase-like amidohydrolase [Maribacter sp.]|jgi:imidazolonepropionase-like amidohydrolase